MSTASCAARSCSRRVSSAPRERRARAVVRPSRSVTTPDGVRQVGRLGEGRAALVVDEQEGAPVGRVAAGRGRRSASGAVRTCPIRWCRRPGRAGPSRHRSTCERPLGRSPQGGHQPVAVGVQVPSSRPSASRRRPVPGRSSSRTWSGSERAASAGTRGGQVARELGWPYRGGAGRRAMPRAIGEPLPAEHRRVAGLAGQPEDGADRRPGDPRRRPRRVRTSTPTSRAARQASPCTRRRAAGRRARPAIRAGRPARPRARPPACRGPAPGDQPGQSAFSVVVVPRFDAGRAGRAPRRGAGAEATGPTPSRASRLGAGEQEQLDLAGRVQRDQLGDHRGEHAEPPAPRARRRPARRPRAGRR